MPRETALAYVLGGGRGTRLDPLTRYRAKPAVPFGGMHRVIDFVLSNLYHSGVRKIRVLTQFESESLQRHIENGWYPRFGIGGDEYLKINPAKQSVARGWYLGTADAIHQNRRHIEDEKSNVVDIFGGDHIYMMDVSQMNEYHLKNEADLTISAIPVERELAAGNYGVLVVDDDWKLQGFEEKPKDPTPMPGNEKFCLASMGNYAFRPKVLLEELVMDAKKETAEREDVDANPEKFSTHDFGYDMIPQMLGSGRKIFVYNFNNNVVPGALERERGFWRDIGSIDQFFDANMDVRKPEPLLNLYNPEWEILTYNECSQPAKIVGGVNGGGAIDSLFAPGVIVSHSSVKESVLSYDTRVKEGCDIKRALLLGGNIVGEGVVIKDAIVDKHVEVPDGERIGVDKERDKERGFTISNEGITVVPRGYCF